MKCPFCNGHYRTDREIYKHCLDKHPFKLKLNENYNKEMGKKGSRKFILE